MEELSVNSRQQPRFPLIIFSHKMFEAKENVCHNYLHPFIQVITNLCSVVIFLEKAMIPQVKHMMNKLLNSGESKFNYWMRFFI